LRVEKRQQLLPRNLPAERHAPVRAGAVDLKRPLGEIDPDDADLSHD